MNGTIEDDVRAAFERITGPVVPRPDPLGRLLVRRRRRTWRRGVGAAAAAMALALAGGTLAAAPVGSPIGPSPDPDPTRYGVDQDGNRVSPDPPKARVSAWTRRLIDSPTRGNLAGDPGLVEEVARQATASGGAPAGLDRVKVLAVADVSGGRIAVIAHYNDEFASVHLAQAAADAGPADLARGTLGGQWIGLRPFFQTSAAVHQSPDRVENESTVALAPSGCSVDTSGTATIDADGTTHRTWTPRGDHLIVAGDMGQSWWRVTCDGRVRFEGPPYIGGDLPVPGSPAPLRGTADPALVDSAVGAWTFATRHLGGAAPTVLWAGPSGDDRTTVVVTGAGRDGRTLVTAATGGPGGATRAPAAAVYYTGREPYVQEPMAGLSGDRVVALPYGTATAASTDLVAVRLPSPEVKDFRPVVGDRILVVAPPSATKLKAGAETVPLTGGVGYLNAPAPVADLTLTALDATGATVATGRYREPDTTGQFFGEGLVDDWNA
ncbi:hypothetical protein [Virgisporangium aurantiacum]|uniref:Uncharacterized protein n=1 Tax=Virgisporangium aurantiacum TaxID=175570 RepID=A0A8J3Z0T0_9ACTN|nr:hypothetical protein [Virgisporangium aurantiacum]GIJ53105.1 hypothetical protein Vau01_006210 [Virgisporangium aurantiacum]